MLFNSITLAHIANDRSAMPAETTAERRSTPMYKWVYIWKTDGGSPRERGVLC